MKSMSDEKPSLAALLSSQAHVLHRTKRPYIEKRVVELAGQMYVLYRFPRREQCGRFERVLEQARAAGAILQPVVAGGASAEGAGYWLALACLPGELMAGRRFEPGILTALGKTAASLHSVSAVAPASLLKRELDATPYAMALADPGLGAAERKWIAASAERFYAIGRYQLHHGDLHGENILRMPDGRVALIDYELLSFEQSGLELAMILLRGYCRLPKNRQALLKTYLANLPRPDVWVWRKYAYDLLFAAALRLLWQRQRRLGVLKRQRVLLLVRKLFALSSSRRMDAHARLQAIDGLIMRASRACTVHALMVQIFPEVFARGTSRSANDALTEAFGLLRQRFAVSMRK